MKHFIKHWKEEVNWTKKGIKEKACDCFEFLIWDMPSR